MDMLKVIKETILEGIPDAEVHVLDPMQDGVHLEAIVISPSFSTLSLLQQHQRVMRLLTEHFQTNLHALSLKTYTPENYHE